MVVDMEPPGRRINGARVLTRTFPGTLPAWSLAGDAIATKRMSAEALRRGRFRAPLSSDFETTMYALNGSGARLYSRGTRRTPVVWLDASGFLETVRDERGVESVHRVDLQTGERRRLFDYDASIFTRTMAVFSQASRERGELYVFRNDPDGGRRHVVALDLNSGRMKRTVLDLGKRNGQSLKLSPHGDMLAVVATDEFGTFLSRVDVSGANVVEVFPVRNHRDADVSAMLEWTRDGEGILFMFEEPLSVFDLPPGPPAGAENRGSRDMNVLTRQRIMYVDADGKSPPVSAGIVVDSGRVQGLSLSPDGSLLAYGLATGAPELWCLDVSATMGALESRSSCAPGISMRFAARNQP